jgi:hemoglobin
MLKHLVLNAKIELKPSHFKTWLSLFNLTVDEHFKGLIAEEAKSKAENIARLIFSKINKNIKIDF